MRMVLVEDNSVVVRNAVVRMVLVQDTWATVDRGSAAVAAGMVEDSILVEDIWVVVDSRRVAVVVDKRLVVAVEGMVAVMVVVDMVEDER